MARSATAKFLNALFDASRILDIRTKFGILRLAHKYDSGDMRARMKACCVCQLAHGVS